MQKERVTNYIKSGKRAYFTQAFIESAKDVRIIWKRDDGKADVFEYKGKLYKYKSSRTEKSDIYFVLEPRETMVEAPVRKRRVV